MQLTIPTDNDNDSNVTTHEVSEIIDESPEKKDPKPRLKRTHSSQQCLPLSDRNTKRKSLSQNDVENRRDSIEIPETQVIFAVPKVDLFDNEAEDDDDDFYIPETQEVLMETIATSNGHSSNNISNNNIITNTSNEINENITDINPFIE